MTTSLLAPLSQTRWKLGTYESASRGSPIMLGGTVAAAAGARRYTTLRQFRTTAGYQVPTGKTFIACRLRYWGDSSSLRWRFSDGTDDVGMSSAVAPAGEVLIDALHAQPWNALPIVTGSTVYSYDIYFEVPAGRYLAVSNTNGSETLIVEVLGVEA